MFDGLIASATKRNAVNSFQEESPLIETSDRITIKGEFKILQTSHIKFVNSSFALYPEPSEVSARSLSEIDQQEARPQRCSERQRLADSWQGGRNWCSLVRDCGHLVHSTPPYSPKRWETLEWPV